MGWLSAALADKEKRARLAYLAWAVSLAVLALGYAVIFYVLFWK